MDVEEESNKGRAFLGRMVDLEFVRLEVSRMRDKRLGWMRIVRE